MWFRGVMWLIALCAFVLPPSFESTAAMASAGHATMNHEAMSDCPDYAPPPAPCPDKGTGKHAAGLCCPAMAAALAVLPASPAGAAPALGNGYVPWVVSNLTGLSLTKDPPPPRV